MSTTTTQEIPRAEWPFFFDAFSRQHASWLVNLELFSQEIGAQVEGRSLHFEGISSDLKDGEDAISVTLEASPDARVTHIVTAPTHVRLGRSESDAGTFETVEVEAADGTITLVRFLAGVVPEMLDDIW